MPTLPHHVRYQGAPLFHKSYKLIIRKCFFDGYATSSDHDAKLPQGIISRNRVLIDIANMLYRQVSRIANVSIAPDFIHYKLLESGRLYLVG